MSSPFPGGGGAKRVATKPPATSLAKPPAPQKPKPAVAVLPGGQAAAGFVASSMQRRMADMLYPLVEDAPSHTTPAHTRTVASVLRVTARAARCFSFSTCRSSCEVRRAAYRAQLAPRQEMPNLKDPRGHPEPYGVCPLGGTRYAQPGAPLWGGATSCLTRQLHLLTVVLDHATPKPSTAHSSFGTY
jgi:hypothetical protein